MIFGSQFSSFFVCIQVCFFFCEL
uniref:Uncharacterized protein n=1 Tax=Arundo donax TaxID=35708 RepID=A0A0A8YCB6_ARUDO